MIYEISYCRTDIKKREASLCCSLHTLRLVGIAHPVETSNAESPRRYV